MAGGGGGFVDFGRDQLRRWAPLAAERMLSASH
jgi:hypothetical protein